MIAALAFYLLAGLIVASMTRPAFCHNWWVTLALWPWPIAAVMVFHVTGNWPRWTPP